MSSQSEKAARFLELHRGPRPLLMPNPWDAGSARLLASLGFDALATTSAGFAGTLGRLDGGVRREEALAHAGVVVAAVDVPVSADYEDGFGVAPDEVAGSIRLAVATGLAGCSVEDFTRDRGTPIYELGQARDRVAAAAEAAHAGDVHFVITARAENFLYGVTDLDDTIARLQAYAGAGADVVYAPGVVDAADIRRLVECVDVPVNVLALPGVPPVEELAELGVGRVSVGSAFAWVALGAVVEAGRELLDAGTYEFWKLAGAGSAAAKPAFTSS